MIFFKLLNRIQNNCKFKVLKTLCFSSFFIIPLTVIPTKISITTQPQRLKYHKMQ